MRDAREPHARKRPGRPGARARAARRFAWPAAAALLACGPAPGGGARVQTVETVETVVLSLLERPDLRTVVEEPDAPSEVRLLAPIGQTPLDGGALPALVVPPDGAVALEVPEGVGGSTLRLAVGAHASAYRGEPGDAVRFEAVVDGESALDVERPLAADTPRRERVWHRLEHPLEGGEEILLRATAVGDVPVDVAVGFALLDVAREKEVRVERSGPDRPNVVLIVVDTLRADRLGCYGYGRPTSPRVDELAARGVLFEEAFAPSSWTWPSTASLLTGTEPPEHGVVGDASCYLPEGLVSVAEVFRDAGARTGGFSANPLVSADKNFDQGFARFESGLWRAPEVVPEAVAWIDEAPEERFFLYLHLFDPHTGYEPAPDLAERLAPGGQRYRHAAVRRLWKRWMERGEDGALLRRAVERASRLYDAEVATADRALGRLFDALEKRGLADRTLVAFTSDHGEEFLEHDALGHGKQLFRETLHVPLILAGPGVPRGERRAEPVEMRWIGGTLLRLAGLAPAGGLDTPDLFGGGAGGPHFFAIEPGYWRVGAGRGELVAGLYACRDGDAWLTWARDATERPTALFDLAADPAAAETDRLRRAIEDWLAEGAEARGASHIEAIESTRALLRELGYAE